MGVLRGNIEVEGGFIMTLNTTNVTDFLTMAQFANEQTNYIFGVLLLIGCFLIPFMAFGLYRKKNSFTVSSFIAFLSSIVLSMAGIINPDFIIVTIIMTAVGVIFFQGDK